MSKVKQVVLQDLLTASKDGDWGRDDALDGYIPVHVIRGTDFQSVRKGKISPVPLRHLPANTVGRRTLQSNDILIETAGGSRDRPTGRTLLIRAETLECFPGPVTCASFARFLRVDAAAADPRYVYWLLQDLYNSGGMWEHQVQHTGVARFQYTRFAQTFRFTLPDRRQQECVADLLGALDDKIAVNDRIADTSDQLSAALLQRLLPQDSEAREVKLGEIAEVNQRSVKPTPGECLRYIDISSVSAGRIQWPERSSWNDAPGRARRAVTYGDTIWSTVRPGRRSYALIVDDDPEIIVSTGFAVLTPRAVGPAFLYEILRRDEFVGYLESVAEGSAYPAVRSERFALATVPLLSATRLMAFEAQAMPIRRRIRAAEVESRMLADLRDALLPKVMSGEIRIRDAEKVVEDAT